MERTWERLLGVLLVAAALGGCEADEGGCDPEGDRFARVPYGSIGLVVADGRVYWMEAAPHDESRVVGVVVSRPEEGGEPQELYRSDAPEALLRGGLRVADGAVYWLDPCAPAAPTCARVMTVPTAGGAARTLVEDRVYAFTVAGDDLWYATSDERGLEADVADGVIWRLPLAGGSPEAVVEDLPHLRAVLVHEGWLYWSELSVGVPDGDRRARVMRRPIAGGEAEVVLDQSGAGGGRQTLLTLAGDHLYFQRQYSVYRLPLAGGAPAPLLALARTPFSGLAVGEGVYAADPGYWEGTTDDEPGVYRCGAIRSVAPGGGRAAIFAAGQRQPSDVALGAQHVYWLNQGQWGGEAAIRRRALD